MLYIYLRFAWLLLLWNSSIYENKIHSKSSSSYILYYLFLDFQMLIYFYVLYCHVYLFYHSIHIGVFILEKNWICLTLPSSVHSLFFNMFKLLYFPSYTNIIPSIICQLHSICQLCLYRGQGYKQPYQW